MPNWKKVIISGSNAVLNDITASGAATIQNGLTVTGSTSITGSLIVEGSGSTIFEVIGSEGQLFSITDNLSGSLFAVSDVSGLPILEVFSDDKIVAGAFNNEALIISGSHTTLKDTVVSGSLKINNTLFTTISSSVSSGTTTLYTFTDYEATHAEYKVKNGSNLRTGTVIGCWDNSNVDYTETSINGLGNTSDVSFAFTSTGQLQITTSGTYEVKVTARAL